MVSFGQSVCVRANWFYSGKVVVFEQKRCIHVSWSNSGTSGCNCAKLLSFGRNGCIRETVVVFWTKAVIFLQSGCIRAKWLFSGKSGLNRTE